jgi:four helix bundle protein
LEGKVQYFDAFESIPAWQEARELTGLIYKATVSGPWELEDVLGEEMRRTAISIPSKIAQGWGMQDPAQFRRMASTARGQIFVLKTHMYLAMDLGYTTQEMFDQVDNALESTLGMIDLLLDGLKRGTFRRGFGGRKA